MVEPVSIQIDGRVTGNSVVKNHKLVANTNHGSIIYKQSAPWVKQHK